MTKEFLYNFIKQHQYAVLATVSKDNSPEAAVVGIAVTKDLKLILDTVSDSRKFENLKYNPKIAFVIGWENEETVQYEGSIIFPEDAELKEMKTLYLETFPDGLERETWSNIAYVCIEPKWVRYSNFNKDNGSIEEMIF